MVILGTYYILKLYPIRFFFFLMDWIQGMRGEKRVKDDSKYSVQNRWNNEVDIC